MITENLFDLTEEQVNSSKMIYDGKVIKCLIAPYHNFSQLESQVSFTKHTYLFPEREMTSDQIRSLISLIVSNKEIEEARIITANQNVILDMIDSSVRILTESGEVVPCPIKTFMANIHDIRYSIFESENFRISKEEKFKSRDIINNLIDIVNKHENLPMESKEYESLISKIKLIGEDLIRNKLLEMASDIKVNESKESLVKKKESLQSLIRKMEKAIKEENYELAAQLKKDMDF